MEYNKNTLTTVFFRFGLAIFILMFAYGCSEESAAPQSRAQSQIRQLSSSDHKIQSRALQPLPLRAFELDPDLVALGRDLFHDVRLSGNNTVSCASCHEIKQGGVDGQKLSTGVKGRKGNINAPTVFNAAFNFKQFWDGRADTLEAQINGPIRNAKEMDSNWPEIIAKLNLDNPLKQRFLRHFDDGINAANIRHAIASYERSLTTPNSRLDQYLRGSGDALSAEEISGLTLFNNLGCSSCHQGINIGGNMFQSFGVMRNYFKDRGNITKADYGRYNVTKLEQDRYRFKVPSLRNVALTAPYFHDGSAQTLALAVSTMAYYQLGLHLKIEEVDLLVKFLHTLTGESFNPNMQRDKPQ